MKRPHACWTVAVVLGLLGCQSDPGPGATHPARDGDAAVPAAANGDPATWTEAEWKKRLTPLQFNVLRQKGTEWRFTGKYWNFKGDGVYHCAGCNHPLFDSTTKFKSGTGWPSYWQPLGEGSVKDVEDRSHGMVRTEVVCARCNGHLGHVFPDGPKPTGLRYCINSAALTFKARAEVAAPQKTPATP